MALAPSRSLRPQPRVTPEERRLRDLDMAGQFAALEARADIDPLLVNDALRRLGYREIGGLQGATLSRFPDEAFYSRRNKQIEIGSNFFADPVMAHEAAHAGFDVIRDVLPEDPTYRQMFRDADLSGFPTQRFEEAVVEIGDDPTASWNLPRDHGSRVYPQGETVATLEPTLDFIQTLGPRERARVGQFNDIMQQIAEEELSLRGEPPRAVMREPQPGSMFYQEPPEQERGLGGLLRRFFSRP